MEDESRCSVCFEVFREPCTLPCGHSFCLSCIQATFERAPHRKCPLCGEKLPYGHKLRVSIVLRNMVQELEKAAAVCSGQHGAASEQPAVAAAQSDVASGAAGWAATEPSQAGQQAAAGASLQHAVSSAAVPSPARTGAASEPLVCAVQASQAPHGQSEEETSRPSHNRSASRGEQQHWHQRQHGGAAAAASGTQWPVGRRQPSLTGAAPASGVAAAAQLVLWALCSARAGLLHDCLWVAVGVALPPALAVWEIGRAHV